MKVIQSGVPLCLVAAKRRARKKDHEKEQSKRRDRTPPTCGAVSAGPVTVALGHAFTIEESLTSGTRVPAVPATFASLSFLGDEAFLAQPIGRAPIFFGANSTGTATAVVAADTRFARRIALAVPARLADNVITCGPANATPCGRALGVEAALTARAATAVVAARLALTIRDTVNRHTHAIPRAIEAGRARAAGVAIRILAALLATTAASARTVSGARGGFPRLTYSIAAHRVAAAAAIGRAGGCLASLADSVAADRSAAAAVIGAGIILSGLTHSVAAHRASSARACHGTHS